MSDDARIEELLDLWEELRESNSALSFDEFVNQHCPAESKELLGILQRKIEAIQAIDECFFQQTGTGEAEVETESPGTTDNLNAGKLRAGSEPIPGYRLVSTLGQGGFGEVWKAEVSGGFHVALKFVRLDRTASESELRSLELIKRLRHPNLISTIGAWQKDGWLIIASELVGQSLQDRLDSLRAQGQSGLPKAELLAYMKDAAKALDYLNKPQHPLGDGTKGGIQHRDIKPRNLLLSGGGLKVADLGIARVLESGMTGHTGAMSVSYAAPEFFQGRTSERSDQYSLAVTYCQLRGDKLPFEGNDVRKMKGHLDDEPDLSMIPEEEWSIVRRALSKDPGERWNSCGSFVSALESLVPPAANREEDSAVVATQANHDLSKWLLPGLVAMGVCVLGVIWMGMPPRGRNESDVAPRTSESPTGKQQFRHDEAQGVVEALPTSQGASPESSAVIAATDRRSTTSLSSVEPLLAPRPPPEMAARAASEHEEVDTSKNRMELIREFVGHTDHVRCVAFTPDGAQAISGDEDGVIRLWNVATGMEAGFLRGHTKTVHRVAVFPDGRTAASASYDKTARIWNLESGEQIQQFQTEGDARALTLFSTGIRIITGTRTTGTRRSDKGVIQAWKLGFPKQRRRFQTLSAVWALDCSPDGESVASGSASGQVELRYFQAGTVMRIGSHPGLVTSVLYLPAGDSVVARSIDGKIRLWNVANGEMIAEMQGAPGYGRVSLSADGRFCLAAGEETTLWDLSSKTLIERVAVDKDQTERFSFDVCIGPEGKRALISVGNVIQLWKLPDLIEP